MAFADYTAELLNHIPELGIGLSGRLVNRAYRDIRESRLWSWLRYEGVLVAPPLIGQSFNVPVSNQGSVSVTQYSNVVTLDATANSVLNNLANPLITSRQFRAGPQNGGVYNIAAYNNGTSTLTLDRIYQEPSATSAPYQVYRCYYTPTDNNGNAITDFLSFIAMKNPDIGYRISRTNLHRTPSELDDRDPLRCDQGFAYWVATYKANTATNSVGVPIYELWPHPVYGNGYTYLGRRRGCDMVLPTDDIPLTLSKDLLMERAQYYACEWAGKQVGRFPQLRGTDWRFQVSQHNTTYQGLLRDAKRQDDEMMSEDYIPSQWADEMFVDEDLIVSSLLSSQSNAGWQGG